MASAEEILALTQALSKVLGVERVTRIETLAPRMDAEQLERLHEELTRVGQVYVEEAKKVHELVAEAKGVILAAKSAEQGSERRDAERRERGLENSEAEALIQSLNQI